MPKKSGPIFDHIFGDLDQPQVAVPWMLQRLKGIQHAQARSPRSLRLGETCHLEVTSSAERPFSTVCLWYSTDEWQTRQQLSFEKGQLTWDTLSWNWLQHWQVTLPAQESGTMLRYKIAGRLALSDRWVYADNQAEVFEEGTHYSIWYDPQGLPAWSKLARIYQVFVDRFNPGQAQDWLQESNLMQPCGGNLRGVIEKLDHIQGMGFNAIWLTPIFTSPSHHGYDISNYYQVNPRLGSEADFDELVDQLHQRGMRLILDFVANHCSDQLPQFLDAQAHRDSPFHDWFTWKSWPAQYKCFYDVQNMPEFDLRYGRPARTFMLECACYWLERGADGFRLDYAHGPAQDLWVDFRRACRQVKADCWLFGEIIQPADATRTFAGGLDGSLDFHLCQAIRLTFAQQTWPLSRLAAFLEAHGAYFEEEFSLPSFIDNHDMNRFLIPAHEDEGLLRIALVLLYALPGPPVVYYGTESALSQHRSIHGEEGLGFDEARLPMEWDKASRLGDLLKSLSELRSAHPSLLGGGLALLVCNDQEQVLVLRIGSEDDPLYLLINRSTCDRLVCLENISAGKLVDGLSGQTYPAEQDRFIITLQSRQAYLLIPG